MMEEILYLEADEEITSVIDKLKMLSGKQVALVLPKHASLSASVVNLRLLVREAERLGKEIVLVTQDKIGIKLASQVGIPVYASVTDDEPIPAEVGPKPQIEDVIELETPGEDKSPKDKAGVPVKHYNESKVTETVVEEKPKIEAPRSQSALRVKRKRLMVTALGSLAIALIAASYWFFVLFPQASIKLTVKSEPLEQSVQVTVDNNSQAIDDSVPSIPGQKLEIDQSYSDNFQSTGEKEIGTNATGTVDLSNRLGEPVTLSAGAELARNGLSFRTNSEVTIPSATVSLDAGGEVRVTPGTTSVGVEAAAPGEDYNLGAGSFSISGLSGSQADKVSASNSTAFAGGQSQTIKVVTEGDINRAKDSLIDGHKAEIEQALKDKAGGKTVIASTIEYEVVTSNPSAEVDAEADSFDLEATIRGRVFSFSFDDLEEVVLAKVSAGLPDDRELVVDRTQDAIETTVESVDFTEGLMVLNGNLRTEVVHQIDQEAFKRAVSGKLVSEAEEFLKSQEAVIGQSISLRPSYRDRIPARLDQIKLEFVRQDVANSDSDSQ